MRCSKADRLISLAFDGMLDSDTQRALDAHVANCPRCRTASEQLALLTGQLDSVEAHEPQWGFAERLSARMDADEKSELGMRGWVRRLHLAGVGVALIGFGLGIAASSGLTVSSNATTTTEAVAVAETDPMEQLTQTHFAPIPDDSTGGVLLAMLTSMED